MNIIIQNITNRLQEYLLLESIFDDKVAKWSSEGHEVSEVKSSIEKYKQLKNKKLLQGNEQDISSFKTYEQLQQLLDKYSDYKSKTQVEKEQKLEGAKLVYENDKCKVYQIFTMEASILLSKGTKWCLGTNDKTINPFNTVYGNYTKYFVLSKTLDSSNPLYKVAVLVDEKRKEVKIWDSLNTQIPSESLKYFDVMTFKVFKDNIIKSTPEYLFSILNERKIKYEIKDGKINCKGNVDISYYKLTHFPVPFGVVNGKFLCNDNELISLKGAPERVGKDFMCYNNLLTTLEGGPKIVLGSFWCDNNPLKSLKGAPERVGGSFHMAHTDVPENIIPKTIIKGRIYR